MPGHLVQELNVGTVDGENSHVNPGLWQHSHMPQYNMLFSRPFSYISTFKLLLNNQGGEWLRNTILLWEVWLGSVSEWVRVIIHHSHSSLRSYTDLSCYFYHGYYQIERIFFHERTFCSYYDWCNCENTRMGVLSMSTVRTAIRGSNCADWREIGMVLWLISIVFTCIRLFNMGWIICLDTRTAINDSNNADWIKLVKVS